MKLNVVLNRLEITQCKLADLLGVSRQSVSNWKTRNPDGLIPQKQAMKLANKYPTLEYNEALYRS